MPEFSAAVMRRIFTTGLAALCLAGHLGAAPVRGQERVFSGPQPGEKLTGFKVLDVVGPNAGKEADYVAQFAGAPTVLIFVHGVERSMVPFLTAVDEYGHRQRDKLKTLFVFLTDDRPATEQRLPLIRNSLRLEAPAVISLDGIEGPGNYGLNRMCLATVVTAREGRVTANFALVQPGIVDAPGVIRAMAALAGDANPPDAEALRASRQQRDRLIVRPGLIERPAARPDLARLDLSTEAGLRDAVRALIAEVQALRAELARLRGAGGRDAPVPPLARPGGELPGAAPTDERLIGLLRRFIQPTNTDADVDRVVKEVLDYVSADPVLRKQAVDGWTRVGALKYGTPYAQKAGAALVARLKQ